MNKHKGPRTITWGCCPFPHKTKQPFYCGGGRAVDYAEMLKTSLQYIGHFLRWKTEVMSSEDWLVGVGNGSSAHCLYYICFGLVWINSGKKKLKKNWRKLVLQYITYACKGGFTWGYLKSPSLYDRRYCSQWEPLPTVPFETLNWSLKKPFLNCVNAFYHCFSLSLSIPFPFYQSIPC